MEESPEKEMRCVFDDFAYFFVKTYVVVLIRIASPRRGDSNEHLQHRGERGGLVVVEPRTPEREVRGSIPTSTM